MLSLLSRRCRVLDSDKEIFCRAGIHHETLRGPRLSKVNQCSTVRAPLRDVRVPASIDQASTTHLRTYADLSTPNNIEPLSMMRSSFGDIQFLLLLGNVHSLLRLASSRGLAISLLSASWHLLLSGRGIRVTTTAGGAHSTLTRV